MIQVIIRTVRLRNIKSSKHPKLFRVPLDISFEKPLNPDHYLGMSFTTLFLIPHSYFEIIVFIFEIKKKTVLQTLTHTIQIMKPMNKCILYFENKYWKMI